MPSWNRIIYGTNGSDTVQFTNRLYKDIFGVDVSEDDAFYEVCDKINEELFGKLEQVTKNLLKSFGARVIRANRSGYRFCKTEFGNREIQLLSFQGFGDEDNLYRFTGIGLTARYFPSILDFNNEHGGIEEGLICSDYWKYFDEIKTELNTVHSMFKELNIHTVTCFS